LDTVATETPARRATAASVVRLVLAGAGFLEPAAGDRSAVVITSPPLRTESFEIFRHVS
jgi:hypothetical protein